MSEETATEHGAIPALPPWLQATAQRALALRSRWPQAMLLSGRRGIGKRALALYFARALLCEQPQADGNACGTCPGCRYVDAGAHPDLRLIEPITYDDEGNATRVDSILVDRIRDLIEFTQLTTHRGGMKVAVFVPAESMNAAAKAALLKTLEEPPGPMYLLLVSHQPALLPATILSRCQRLPVPDPEPQVAAAWLAEHGIAQPELVLAQAGGAPLYAVMLGDPIIQRDREWLVGQLAHPERLSPVAFGARLETHAKDERKAWLGDAVYWLLTWVADIAAVDRGGSPRFHPDQRDALRGLAGRVARPALFRYYRSLMRQRGLLAHPLQPRWVGESLLIEYRRLFSRGASD
jgi:DNA polymerase III subunit delta'